MQRPNSRVLKRTGSKVKLPGSEFLIHDLLALLPWHTV